VEDSNHKLRKIAANILCGMIFYGIGLAGALI